MSSAFTFRFTQNDSDWRVLCQAATGRCFIWRNGSFLRSTTYSPKQGFADEDRVIAEVVPRLLSHMALHEALLQAGSDAGIASH